MPLKEQLNSDLRDSLRSQEEVRKGTIRLILAAIHNAEIAAGKPLDDASTNAVLAREAKQRRESIEEFGKAGRADLVAKESAELEVILQYLPPQLSREEIEAAVRQSISQVGATGPADKGKVMGPIMAQLRGKADGSVINEIVTEILSHG
jgi:uncharacterized protein YqeY